jgi:ubiquinone/menaquinone biosynthesis C-methylase UbiE
MAATTLSSEDAERLRGFERRVHDAVSAGYYDFFTPVTLLASEPLLDAVGLSAGMRLLDVASGPGSVAAAAVRRAARPVGIDLAPRMVELARRLNPGIEFLEADVEHLPFSDRSFDALVCSFGLGHFPYPEAAVTECLRVVTPGGGLAFSWWDVPSRQRVQGLFRDAIAEVGARPAPDFPARHSMLRFCDPAALAALLSEAGLSDVAVRDHTGTRRFKSADEMWQGAMTGMGLTGAALKSQDAPTLQAIREAFERRALEYSDGDGLSIPVAFRIGVGRRPS